jgi:hypothetical protein
LSLATCATNAHAQLYGSLDAALSASHARASFITMAGLDNVSSGTTASVFAGRAGFALHRLRLDADAGILHGPADADAIAAGARVALPIAHALLQLRVSGAHQGGDSIRNDARATIEYERNGFLFAFGTRIARGLPAQFQDTALVFDNDSSAIGHILIHKAQAPHFVGTIAGGYRKEWQRFTLSGDVTARMADISHSSVAASLTASARLLSNVVIGASSSRESAHDWLDRLNRSTTMLFVRMDMPSTPDSRGSSAAPFAIVVSGDTTLLSIRAGRGSRVEIAGDFSDWRPLVLDKSVVGTWAKKLVLPPGLYHFKLRIDGGKWTVPKGLPSTQDDFGGKVAVFEVRGS